MHKLVWVLIGIVLIAVGLYTLIPQGLGWWEELVTVFEGAIGIVLILAGVFCFFIAKI